MGLHFPSFRSCIAIAHIVFGVITVLGAVYRMASPPQPGIMGHPFDEIFDMVFGLLISVTSTLWLINGAGWGRYVAYVWLFCVAIGVYFGLSIVLAST
ncbi:hypothetical protein Pan258_16530 [Symmachiella dynata]|uniref:hypothetical protein n=1 Tax=Symmachiella dynata TaxID=2527995 RepID=UPI0011896142|nr:hypothetical protein [Symmachiella dynata]QDT47617.1 hypothetical protein Pan258_16530 [Symmachiella dynata]